MVEQTADSREAPEAQLEANRAAQYGYDHWIKSTGCRFIPDTSSTT